MLRIREIQPSIQVMGLPGTALLRDIRCGEHYAMVPGWMETRQRPGEPDSVAEDATEKIAVEEKGDFEETSTEPKDKATTSALTDTTATGRTKPKTRKR